MGSFTKLFRFIEKNLTWLQLITGGGLLSAVAYGSKLAAEQTPWIANLGPYGILLAAFGGALLMLGLILLMIWGRYAWAKGSAMNEWRASVGDKFNPMEGTFRNQRIRLLDIVSPATSVVSDKTFIDCELLGPGVVIVTASRPGAGGFNGVTFGNCDWVLMSNGARPQNTIVLSDCNFLRGSVHRIVFFVPESAVASIQMPGMNWITPLPNPPSAAT